MLLRQGYLVLFKSSRRWRDEPKGSLKKPRCYLASSLNKVGYLYTR